MAARKGSRRAEQGTTTNHTNYTNRLVRPGPTSHSLELVFDSQYARGSKERMGAAAST